MKALMFMAMLSCLCAACATTRTPQPVATKQSGDSELTCEQIAVEYRTNTEVAANKISKNRSDDTHDVVVGVALYERAQRAF